MARYLVGRLLQAVLTVVGVSAVTFGLVFLSGDPAVMMAPPDSGAEEIARIRSTMGFDQPIYVQYGRFVLSAIRGDFPPSLRYRESSMGLVLDRLPATVLLVSASMALSVSVGLSFGILAATRPNSLVDSIVATIGALGQSIPVYWSAILLILVFAVKLRWFPPSGYGGPEYVVLPALSLAFFTMPKLLRLTRQSMLEALRQDYVRTARAKGLSNLLVLRRHALRNALIPLVTIIGLDIGLMFGGAIITETVFAWPGLGSLIVEAVTMRDFPLVQAAVLVIATLIVSINLVVDVLYAYLDPRIKFA